MPLYLVASPIGNLKDISFRAIETLEKSDIIFCEDTRVSSKLLNHYNIKIKLKSYHQHSSKNRVDEILKLLKEDKKISYLSDAGMPCISDPGKVLVNLCIENTIEYTIIPGPSALVSAYAISSFSSKKFTYLGFLPKKNLKEEVSSIKNIKHPVVIYESPHRVERLLKECLQVLGDRKITIAREISKIHESFLHGMISHVLQNEEIKNPKGEFVIVIEGSSQKNDNLSDEMTLKIAKKRINDGEKISSVAKDLASVSSLSRNQIYKILSE